jgi:hypothetical protein
MSLISRLCSAPTARLAFAAALVLGFGSIHPGPLTADEDVILAPQPLVRKFPQDFFCMFPIDLAFTANGPTATIHAVGNIYVNSGGSFLYTHQAIDNMFVVTDADYAAHTVNNDGSYQFCYDQAHVPTIFLFDLQNLATAKLAEKFALGATGWDLTQGAYFDVTKSADNDPSTGGPHDHNGGCLGLGLETPSPSLSDSARTSVVVSGLTSGQVYHLAGWWTVGDGIFTNQATLSIKITGSGSTPVASRTWGAVKRSYR